MKKNILNAIPFIIGFALASCSNNNNPNAQSGDNKKPESGEAIYKRTCITCHQTNGEGVPFTYPPLAKSDFLNNRENSILQLINGKMGELIVNGVKYNNIMPPQMLNDDELAAVLTYVYSNFGNSGKAFTADEVKAVRSKHN
jgi:nitrite reductase (NO-forming)